jgi:hypothetical protein
MLIVGLVVAGCVAAGCAGHDDEAPDAAALADPVVAMNRIAESYVRLALAAGQRDPDFVDAYSGPPEWKAEAEAERRPLEAISQGAATLIGELEGLDVSREEEMVRLRREYLLQQLGAMRSRVAFLEGTAQAFDEESKALYDAVAPTHPESHFREVLDRLEARLPGDGPLVDRYERFKEDFIIPKEKLDAVFQTAIAEARRRTRQHLELPSEESFRVEYVTDKPWGGYNWYQGKGHSLIQVNTDLPIYIDRAMDLACHEGYPGHHVYNVLLEHHLLKGRGWIEFSVYPLFSAQSLIAEGTANYGREVAFSRAESLAFERDVLFPLAGLDAARVEEYHEIVDLVEELNYAGNEAARRYLDGAMDRDAAAEWLATYALMSLERARLRIRFIDKYRSYVINYNLGQDLVRAYIEGRGGTEGRPERRWEEFGKLLSSPRLPSGLTRNTG